jgi:hypothetical protein
MAGSRKGSEQPLEIPYVGKDHEAKPYITFKLMLEGKDLAEEAGKYTAEGKYAQAEHLLIEHLQILSNQYGQHDERLCDSLLALSGNYLGWNKFDAAEKYANLSKDIYETGGNRHALDALELLEDITRKREGLEKRKNGKKVYRRRSSARASNQSGSESTEQGERSHGDGAESEEEYANSDEYEHDEDDGYDSDESSAAETGDTSPQSSPEISCGTVEDIAGSEDSGLGLLEAPYAVGDHRVRIGGEAVHDAHEPNDKQDGGEPLRPMPLSIAGTVREQPLVTAVAAAIGAIVIYRLLVKASR